MRVALFTNNYLPFRGGVTTSVETLRRGLSACGHEVWVFAPRFRASATDPPWVFRYPSIPAATYPEFALAIPWAPGLAARARTLDVDVVHAHHPFLLGPAARRLARRMGRPLVFTYHTRYEKYAHYVPVYEPLAATLALVLSVRFAATADAVIAPSVAVRDQLVARGVRVPITVIPTGVDLEHFRPGEPGTARQALGLDQAARVLLYVGRLDREKSVERVLLAFDRIAAVVPRARLLLVGQGTEAAHLAALARTLSAGHQIDFVGVRPHEDLPPYYQAADLFLFASETETQGLVLAEAAACGLPVVAVSAPGTDEVVRDGESGLLTKADPAAMAEAAVSLLLDDARRGVMALQARRLAERSFDARAQVERTLAVYAEAVARQRRGGRG